MTEILSKFEQEKSQVCLITTPISSPTKTKPSRIFWNDEDIPDAFTKKDKYHQQIEEEGGGLQEVKQEKVAEILTNIKKA